MIEPKELVEFRKQWKQELTAPDLRDTVSDSKSRTSVFQGVRDNISVVDKNHSVDKRNSESDCVCDSQSDHYSDESPSISQIGKPDTSKGDRRSVLKRSWDCVADIREQTNVLQPFLIAENLLKGESGRDSLVGARGTVNRLSRNSTVPSSGAVGASQARGVKSKADFTSDERSAKRRKTDAPEKSTFLDLFINDLVSLLSDNMGASRILGDKRGDIQCRSSSQCSARRTNHVVIK